MMAVYIDKYQMYFWVIVTENHQYILYSNLNPYPIFCSHFPFLPLTGMIKTIHAPVYLFIMVSICMSRIGYPRIVLPWFFFF